MFQSLRGVPVQAQTRCFRRTLAVVSAFPSLNVGSMAVTGVSQENFPSSTSFASISVVSAFVLDATMNSVFSSTGAGAFLPSSRTPKPPANATLPS